MALTVFNNPINSFWHDQNLKLLATPSFMSERGDYYSDEWCFDDKRRVTRIDFSVFDLPIFNLDSPCTLKKNESECTLSSKQYAKLLCSAVLTPKFSTHIVAAYQMAMQLFAFLNERHETVLSTYLLDDFWTSFMARSVNENGFFSRVSSPKYKGFIKPVSLPQLRNQLMALGVTGVIESRLTLRQVEKSLDGVCQSQYSMTLAEFKKGGSFNFLGLELGQYYVDYLNHVYQNSFLYTAVCKQALSTVVAKVDMAATDRKSRNRLFNVILAGLFGDDLDTSQVRTKGVYHQDLKLMIEHALVCEYRKHVDSVCSLSEKNIESLVIELGLSSRFDAVEVIRVLMLQKYLDLQGHKSPYDVWNGYLSSLEKSFLDSQSLSAICVDDVYSKMQSRVNQQRLTGKESLTAIQQWAKGLMATSPNGTYHSFKALLDTQVHAMTMLVVAWTGYRVSEYGFPLSAIRAEPNLDILDNAHVPFRFKLKWLVPKTNGSTKINREVTSQCYQVAAQLNEILGCGQDEPCLFAPKGLNPNKKNIHKSERFMTARINSTWAGFVNYRPFNEVMTLNDLLQKNKELTPEEKDRKSVV